MTTEPKVIRWREVRRLSILEPSDHVDLQRGDVVFVFSDGLSGWLIRWWTGRRHDRVAVNHVALVFDCVQDRGMIIDAQPPTIHLRSLHPRYNGKLLAVYRPTNVTPEALALITGYASRYVGKRYGWGKILLQFLGLGRLSFLDGFPICSYSVAIPYERYAWRFGRNLVPQAATPESLYDAVRGHLEVGPVADGLGVEP